jgi:hypothetical protein
MVHRNPAPIVLGFRVNRSIGFFAPSARAFPRGRQMLYLEFSAYFSKDKLCHIGCD